MPVAIQKMNSGDIECSIMCRACMKVDGVLLPMYGDDMISTKNLPEKLADLASINIDKYDGLPSVLCAKCAYRTDAFHEFKLQVQATEKKLRKMFQSSNNQNISLKAERNDYESENCCIASSHREFENLPNVYPEKSENDCKEKEESDVKPHVDEVTCEDEVCIVDYTEQQHSSLNFTSEIEENPSELSNLPNVENLFIPGMRDIIEISPSELQTVKHEVSNEIEGILDSDSLGYTLLYIPAEDGVESDSQDAQQVINVDDEVAETEEFQCVDNEEDCEDNEYSRISWTAEDSRNGDEEASLKGKWTSDLPKIINTSDNESEDTTGDLKNSENSNNPVKEATRIDDSDSDYFVDAQVDVLGSLNDTIMRIKEINIDGQLNYQCTLCMQNYEKLTGVLIHTVENHVPSSGPFFCVVCEKDCESHRKLRSHVKTHSGKFPYTCFICNKAYSMKRYLKRHMSCHTDFPRHRCPKCGTRFSVKSELEAHIKSHIDDGGAQFACNQCPRVFNHKGNYKRHLISHLDPRGVHLPKYPCDVCGKRFLNNRNLKTHTRVHTGEKPFKCDICKRAFSQQGNLLNHLKLHLNPRSYTCEVCGKSFNQRATLREHSLLHTGEKPYVCNVCGLAFTFGAALRRHMWTHTHDKPFGCEICNARFVGKYDLKRHMKIHNEKTNNKRKRNNPKNDDLRIIENTMNDDLRIIENTMNDDLRIIENTINVGTEDTEIVVSDTQTIFIEHPVLLEQDSTDITPREEDAEKENVDALFNLIQYD